MLLLITGRRTTLINNFGFFLDLLSKSEFLYTIDVMAFFFILPKIKDARRSGALDD